MNDQDSPAPITFVSRDSQTSIDETSEFCPKFNSRGLIPAIAIDGETREPLMMAWMNEEALRQTLHLGEAVYFPAAGRNSGIREQPRDTPRR